jgi:hypothetical protein
MTRTRFSRAIWALLALVSLSFAAACEGDTSTSPTVTAGEILQVFTGTVPVRGSTFQSFTLTRAGTVELLLASVTSDGSRAALTTAMGLGSGTPNGAECDITTSVTTSPGLTAQLRTAMGPGIYCVRVFDVGNLTAAVNATTRVYLPAVVAPPTGTTTTEIFSSVLSDRGFTSHAFASPEGGTIRVTLTSVGPPAVPIGLGIGIFGGPVPCALSTSVTTGPGSQPQVSANVDRGVYCVQVFDTGTLTGPVPFSLTITRP